MDSRFCPSSNKVVTSDFCLGCVYCVIRFTLDPDNPYCGFGSDFKDFPFPAFTKDSDF